MAVRTGVYRGIKYTVEHPEWLSPYTRESKYCAYVDQGNLYLETVEYDSIEDAEKAIKSEIDGALGPLEEEASKEGSGKKSGPVAKKATFDSNVWTDEKLSKLESDISDVFSQAEREMRKTLEEFMSEYDKRNARWQDDLKAGRVKREQYEAWLESQSVRRNWINGMVNRLATDSVNAEQMALDIVSNSLPTVFAENANRSMFGIAGEIGWDSHSFDLYDVTTVRGLITGDTCVIPKVDVAKSKKWNEQKFTSAITQSILQGDTIEKSAQRLMSVIGMDKSAAIRAARTSITSAQNSGRIESYRRAEAMGIELEQEWMATPDKRTRETHVLLDGQHVKVGAEFVPDGYGNKYSIRFPGDPKAIGEMIYHCRCTLVAWFDGIDGEDPKRWTRLPKGISYDDWKSGYVENRSKEGKADEDLVSLYSKRFGSIGISHMQEVEKDNRNFPTMLAQSSMNNVEAHMMTREEVILLNAEAESSIGKARCDLMYPSSQGGPAGYSGGYFGGGHYWEINSCLRSGRPLSEMDLKAVEVMNEATSGVTRLKQDTVLFRALGFDEVASVLGVDNDFVEYKDASSMSSRLESLVGKSMVDPSFTSTAFEPSGHLGAVYYRIIAREGTPVYARRNGSENEILLAAGVEKHVVGVNNVQVMDYFADDGEYYEDVVTVIDIVV